MKYRIICLFLSLILLAAIPCTCLAGSAEDRIGETNSSSCIAADMDSGEVLYEFRADNVLPPASTAKIMTSLLVLEAVNSGSLALTDEVTVTEEMVTSIPDDASRMDTPLEVGEILTVEELLYANLLASDCMASYILAFAVSGSADSFCELMNTRAEELGCQYTTFTNPAGYPDEAMMTTARSLMLIALECMKQQTFRDIVCTAEWTMPATNLHGERTLTNTNLLLLETIDAENTDTGEISETENPWYDETAIGVKTGSSNASGQCLISAFEKNGRSILIVLLGARMQEYEDGTVSMPQYSETLRVADSLQELMDMKDSVAAELADRLEACSSAQAEYSDRLALVHDRDAVLQEQAAADAAWQESAKSRLPYAAAALAALLILAVPAGIKKKGRHS